MIEIIQHDYLQLLPWPKGMENADLVFADPPYNLGAKYEDDATRDRLPDSEYQGLINRTLGQLRYRMRPGATLWWVCPPDHADWVGNLLTERIGPRLYQIVWHETFAQYQGNRGLTKDFRLIYCHVKPVGPHDPLDRSSITWNPDAIRVKSRRQELGDPRANKKGRVPGTVWKFRRLQGTSKVSVDWHPNQICPELLDRIILGWSNPGDVVLDAFAGTGSMGLRCLEHGRNFVGVDKSPTYCAKMKERFNAAM